MKKVIRTLLRWMGALLAGLIVLVIGLVVVNRPAFGKSAQGKRLERMHASPQWKGNVFENPQPLWNDISFSTNWDGFMNGSKLGSPADPENDVPVVRDDGSRFTAPPRSGLRVTWFGHSSVLIEVDGRTILTDPVWGPSPSPIPWLGPQRWYDMPVSLEDIPPVDAVLISHDHYDHLDYPTIYGIKDWDTKFFVPLGVGAHLEYWGVPAGRIVELDWWQEVDLNGLRIACTPARHASGREIFDQNSTLWAGWALIGPRHRVFFSGDTGLFDDMKRIGTEYGPFDVTMVEVGAYDQAWPDWHIGPEQAVLAHQWLRGDFFIPIHWGMFDLAFHSWTEPPQRTLRAAEKAKIRFAIPKPGQSVEPSDPPPLELWWPDNVEWRTAEQYPVVSTDANGNPPRDG